MGAEPILKEEMIEEYQTGDNKPTYGESFVADIVLAVPKFILNVLGAKDISFLVFQREELSGNIQVKSDSEETTDMLDKSRTDFILGIFPEKYFDGIAIFYDGIEDIIYIPLFVLMVIAGLILLFNNFGADSRTTFKDYLLGFVFVVLCLRFGHLIWGFIVDLNFIIVDLVWVVLKENNINVGPFLETIWGNTEDVLNVKSLGLAILVFVATMMTFVLNYQYAMRMITLSVLIVIFPIIILSVIFPTRRESALIWFHEFTSNVMMQSAHAIAIGMFMALRHFIDDTVSFWILCAFMFGLPAVSTLVQRIVGGITGVQSNAVAGGGMGGNIASAMGMSALMNMSRMVGKGGNSRIDPPVMKDGADTSAGSTGSVPTSGDGMLGRMKSTVQSVQSGVRGFENTVKDFSKGNFQDGMRGVGRGILATAKTAGNVVTSRPVQFGTKATAAMLGAGASAMATGNPTMGAMAGVAAGNVATNLIESGTEKLDALGQSLGETASTTDIRNIDNAHIPGNVTELPEQLQMYGASNEQLAYTDVFRGDNAVSENISSTGTLPSEQFQANESVYQSANRLVGKIEAEPNLTNIGEISAQQAKNTSELAGNLVNPQQSFSSISDSVSNIAKATQNYQESVQALNMIDKDMNPSLYTTQKEVVSNAQAVMNNTLETAQSKYPILQNPQHQGTIQNYVQAQRGFEQITEQLKMNNIAPPPVNSNGQLPKNFKEELNPLQQNYVTAHQELYQSKQKLEQLNQIDTAMEKLSTTRRSRGGL